MTLKPVVLVIVADRLRTALQAQMRFMQKDHGGSLHR